MKFDAYNALSKLRRDTGDSATPATCATPPQDFGPHVAHVAHVAGRTVRNAESGPDTARVAPTVIQAAPWPSGEGPKYRSEASQGRPLTWTGRVVSLDEWRRMSDWDQRGPSGRMFCGACLRWVKPGTCPHCPDRGAP